MRRLRWAAADVAAVAIALVVFVLPFAFIVLTAVKDSDQAIDLDFSWPQHWQAWQNLRDVVTVNDGEVLYAFRNSILLTVVSVALVVVLASMAGYVLQRRKDRFGGLVTFLVLAGLIIPPAIVPTIWVLQGLDLFKSLQGLILVEVAYTLSYGVLLFRAFMAGIPRDLDEAAIIDGASPLRLFFQVIFPLLRPVVITLALTSSVTIFNDFLSPLYFLPGDDTPTVPLTLYNFTSQFSTDWNLLFMDILLITVPPFVAFLVFNRRIVAGMTAGAIKG